MDNRLTQMLSIEHPIIMAPMFLVTNNEMMIAAGKAGIAGCIPALNYRTVEEFKENISKIRSEVEHGVGVNLIVNKSNTKYVEQLDVCVEEGVDFIITSLGSPELVIKKCKEKGIKVFCDVVDLKHAKKVVELGCDALIAVNSGAGGHAGNIPATVLVPLLKEHFSVPVISAGGVGTGQALLSVMALGATGASIGSPFIACTESGVSEGYKKAVIDYGAKDIVMTSKISGTPCTVINTPFVQKIGTEQNLVESFLNKNRQFKKYAKMLTFYKGMKLLEKAAFSATYKSVWCAGPSIESINEEMPIAQIVGRFMSEMKKAKEEICS